MKPYCSAVARLLAVIAIAGVANLGRSQTPAAADAELPLVAPKPINPAVAALLATEPSTNEDLVFSAVALAELGRSDLAKPRLKKVLGAGLSDDASADLARRIGSAMLVRLARIEALAPESHALSRQLLEASSRRARDPHHLNERVRDLTDPSPAVRLAAVNDLKMAGSDAVLVLIHSLAVDRSPARDDAVVDALGAMNVGVVEPVLAALTTGDSILRAHLLNVCRLLDNRASRVVPFLLAPAVAANDPAEAVAARTAFRQLVGELPSRQRAAWQLEAYVRGYLRDTFPLAEDATGKVNIWWWDDRAKTCTRRAYAARQGSLLLAAQLAGELARLAGDDKDRQRLVLLAWLEASAVDGPSAQTYGPLADRWLEKMPLHELERLLEEAMGADHIEAAIAAARMLGKAGAKEAVVGGGDRPTPLVRAIRSGDRRLMVTALRSVIELDPPPFYRGASSVPDALEFLTGSVGRRRALVADGRSTDGRRMAALLTGLGYDSQVVPNGRALLAAARGSADVQLILLRDPIDRTTTRETLYRLRRDWRTSRIPVAVVAAADRINAADRLAASYGVTEAFPPPRDAAGIERLVHRMTELAGRSLLSDSQRRAQAGAALRWLAALADRPGPGYPLQRPIARAETALFVPGLPSEAIGVLAAAGTPSSQRRLIDVVSRPTAPVEQRRQALVALKRSIRQFGILLSGEEMLRQYDRYNASEHAGNETQALLAAILDLLEETSTKARVGPDR